jgi:hypothetical protein
VQRAIGINTAEKPEGGKRDDQIAQSSRPEEEDPFHRGEKSRLLLTAEKGKMMFIR